MQTTAVLGGIRHLFCLTPLVVSFIVHTAVMCTDVQQYLFVAYVYLFPFRVARSLLL